VVVVVVVVAWGAVVVAVVSNLEALLQTEPFPAPGTAHFGLLRRQRPRSTQGLALKLAKLRDSLLRDFDEGE